MTQKFVLVLYRAAAYCHSTVYCNQVSVMLNYSHVATGCCTNLEAFLGGNVIQESPQHTNSIFMNM